MADRSPDGAAAKAFEAWMASPRAFAGSWEDVARAAFLAGFRAALDAVEAKMPSRFELRSLDGPATFEAKHGWNSCLLAVSERIDSLRSPPSQPGQPSERGTKP